MFKKFILKLTPAILSILLITLVLLPIAVWAVGPTEPETRTLVVDFQLDQCVVELWYYNDADPSASRTELLKTGEPVEIPYGEKGIRVVVKPANGYESKTIYQIKDDGTKEGLWASTWATDQFNKSVKLEIECKPKTFGVELLDREYYQFAPDVSEKYNGLQFTYQDSDIVIDRVEKNSGGYTFQRWELVYKVDGVDVPLTLPKNSDGNWIIPASLTIQDQWQNDGKIYLRPVFEPNQYPVWWYDSEMDPDDNNVTTPLRPDADKSMEYMGTMVDLQWKADSYPGYVLNVGKCISYAVDVDDSVDGIARVNKVFRYFDPLSYQLIFEMSAGVDCTPEDFLLESGETIPEVHIYNKDTQLPKVNRTGYIFGGWEVFVNGRSVGLIGELDNLYLQDRQSVYAVDNEEQSLTLRAIWIPRVYDIEYDLGGADPDLNTTLLTDYNKYKYDSALHIPVPVRRGYRFLGWEINGDTSKYVPDLTLEAESYLDTIRLRAVWEAKQFDVVLDPNGGIPEGNVTLPNKVVYDSPLNTTGITVPTRSQYKFLGFFYGDVQYINADGSSACEKWDLDEDLDTGSITLTAKWELLPVFSVNPDDYKLNYKTEKFQFPQGSYRLSFGDDTVEFTIAADGTGSVQIPESFFGNTVDLTVCTPDDTLYSDYHGTIAVPARPEAPSRENDVIDGVYSTDTTIRIEFKDDIDESLYETSLYLNGEVICPWGDAKVFEGLMEGTTYVVLIRVKATDTVPASVSARIERDTDSNGVKEALRQELDALLQPGDGDMVKKLISDAKNQITDLPHSPTFMEDARKIVADTVEAVKFARCQDQNIAALREYRDKLLNTHSYSEENEDLIKSLFEKAELDIQNATNDAAVREIYENAHRDMSDIKVISLQFGDLILIGSNGLHKDHILTLVRLSDFETQAEQIRDAILAGKVIPFGDVSADELTELLKTQDVMAAYSMSLSTTDYMGTFKVTLLLPEDLRGVSGLRVAYFDSTTGTVRVLETETCGDHLTFVADTIADFVILGDPTVNLTIPLIALSLAALCQLIAIALLLKSRSDSKQAVLNYSFVMPTALTIQFFPKHAEWMILILGALVIILQIILMVLLFKSKMIHRSSLKRRRDNGAVMTMATVEDLFAESKPIDPALMYENQPFSKRSDASFLEEISPEDVYEDEASEDLLYDAEENAEVAYYALDDSEDAPLTEEDMIFYEESAGYDEDERSLEEDPNVFVDSVTYSLDENTGELYEDPFGDYTDDLFGTEAPVNGEAVSQEEGLNVVPEDAEAPLFTFEEEEIAYGDPAEPPYEDDAVTGEPEEEASDKKQ